MPTPDYSVDLDLGEPPPELIEYAHQHLGEDPNTRLQAIYELREMIYERGECTPHRMDDEFLIKFLRARKFIPKRAHRLGSSQSASESKTRTIHAAATAVCASHHVTWYLGTENPRCHVLRLLAAPVPRTLNMNKF